MIANRLIASALSVILIGLWAPSAVAETSSEQMLALLDGRIASFDKETVDAASVQLEGLELGTLIDDKTLAYMRSSVEKLVKERGAAVDADRVGEVFQSTIEKVQAQYRLLAPKHLLVALLETYSKAELVAMAAFYKTDTGAAILKKSAVLQSKASALGVYLNTVVLPEAMKEMMTELSL